MSSVLVIGLMVGLGAVGFLDDGIKITASVRSALRPAGRSRCRPPSASRSRCSRSSSPTATASTPGSQAISFLRDTPITLAAWGPTTGIILFVVWANFLITAWSNAVNLTDGLDGLATGASVIFFGAYVLVGIWQINQLCGATVAAETCYDGPRPARPRRPRGGDRGRGLRLPVVERLARQDLHGRHGLARARRRDRRNQIVSRTEILGGIIGGLFVIIVLSVVLQIGFSRCRGKRVFRMAPLHHHFELLGWGEVTIVTRFWIIAGLFTAGGMGLFYAEWVRTAL